MRYGVETIKLRGKYNIIETNERVVIINRSGKEYRMLIIPLNSDERCKLLNPNVSLRKVAHKLDEIPLRDIAPLTQYF